ncbi:MAG: hypothetical protein ACK4MX_04335 [Thermaurantiacus sp.]
MARPGFPEARLGLLLACLAPPASAGELGARLDAEAWWGARTSDGAVSLARLSAMPSIRPTLADGISLDLRLRLEFAPDRTGLGTRDSYAPWSRPLLLTEAGRLELDRAVVQFRSGPTRLTLGKQALAWGVLDGVQVTDRFDAVRRRDWVATDVRPERIGRWAVRLETEVGGLRVDGAFAPDPTVNQQAVAGDAFAVVAPRFRAGLPPDAPTLSTVVDPRTRALADATYGLRLTGTVGRLDATALVMRGPEADPLFLPGLADGRPAIRLAFPRRTVVGGSLVLPAGATVWRLEAAHIPDQPLNLDALATGGLEAVRRPRTIAGLGMDWQAPARLFVNAQLIVDHVDRGGRALARPDTDVIATLRVHRDLAGDTVRLRAEILADLGRGDALLRPAIQWKVDDRFTVSGGADLFTGTREGVFGQFRRESRLWLKLASSF